MLRRLPSRLSSSSSPTIVTSTSTASIRRVHAAFSVKDIENQRPRPPLKDLYKSEQKKYTLARTGHMVPEGGVLPSMLREYRKKAKQEEREQKGEKADDKQESMEQVMQIRNRMVHDSDNYQIRDHASRKIQRQV